MEISVNGDAIEFDTDRFEVAAGTGVVLCFKNVSSVLQHNWVLVNDGTKDEVAERGLAAGAENDWVQPGDPDVIANVKLLDPGEKGEVRFTSPVAGTYQFVCTFPAHNFTMFGEFVVTP
ncbi:MAG: auracyanin [Chloroflexi bacterium]|nr:auracyanin [Chloroflexota bacterium]